MDKDNIQDKDVFASIDEMVDKAESSKGFSSRKGGGGSNVLSCSVVNHKNGKRVKLSKALLEGLGSPETIQVKFDKANKKMFIAKKFSDKEKTYKHAPADNQIFYGGGLSSEIVEKFGLNYEGISSRSFPAEIIQSSKGYPIAVVDMACEDNADEVAE